jgi:polyisoprenoid-binding protein YceI
MRADLLDGSRILIDLRAAGLLRAAGHSPTLVAQPPRLSFDLGDGAIDIPVEARFAVDAIVGPADIPQSDRDKMIEHLRGPDVLDVGRFPTVDLHARYAGSLNSGALSGDLVVLGVPRHVAVSVRIVREGDKLSVNGTWEGTLTDLGVKPFKALFGMLKLQDWIRVRLDLQFALLPTGR